MIIKALTIENFKGIREPVRVEFKPITLLFGPNSAGKSTIVQALHYAREIFERENVDPGKTHSGGSAVDLGGFRSLVNNHDLTRSISLRFDLDLSNEDLPEYLPRTVSGQLPAYADELVEAVGHTSRRVKNGWVQITVSWSETLERPVVAAYEVGINGEILGRIVASKDTRQVSLAYLNWQNSGFHDDDVEVENDGMDNDVNYNLNGLKSALPIWGKALEIEGIPYGEDTSYLVSYGMAGIHAMLVGTGELLRDTLKSFRYLGPLREIPARCYDLALSPDESRWASGIAAWDILYRADSAFIENVNSWLSREDLLNAGYRVEVKRHKELDMDNPVMLALEQDQLLDDTDLIRQELAKLPIKTRAFLRDLRTGIEVLPQDVGVGISQVLPVIVACLDSRYGIVAIEQPELHIHPAFQVAIGDLFIAQAQANQSVFLLETHSEHLLLRLLRRIRETTDNELPPEVAGLTPEQLSVNYVERAEDGLQIRQLQVSRDGDSLGEWPRGFFEERAKELL